MEDLRERITQTNNPAIPNLSPNAPLLLEKAMDDDVELSELVTLVEQNPSITMRLISVANSAWSAPQSEIIGLEQACVRLGMGVVKSIVVVLTLQSPFQPIKSAYFDIERFWSSGFIMTSVIEKISPFFHSDLQLSRTIGLIRHIGLLWLFEQSPRDVDMALASVKEDAESSLEQQLISICGLGYIEATTHLFHAWELPEILVIAAKSPIEISNSFADMLRVAWACTQGLYDNVDNVSFDFPSSEYITEDTLNTIYQQLSKQTEKVKELSGTLFLL